jgi:Ca-activated chloride channel homolog
MKIKTKFVAFRTVHLRGALLLLLAGLLSAFGQDEAEITGVVTDQDGQVVAGALVGVLDQQAAGMNDTKTDASGRFRVSGLRSNSLYRLVVTKYGYSQTTVADVQPSHKELTVQLTRDHSVMSQPSTKPGATVEKLPEAGEEEPFKLSVAVEEILLNISVEDAAGRPVTDLNREDFAVFQDGVDQEIKSFGRENVPISAILLVDTSSSMQGSPLVEAKVAALAFLNEISPRDAVSLIAFGDKVQVVHPFDQDLLKIRTGVHSLTPRGGTALYDAISKAIELMETAPHPRHVIILLSDGKDEDSSTKFAGLDQKIQASDVVLFSIGEYAELDRKLFMSGKKHYKLPEVEVNLNPVWVLNYLADLSGGRAFFPKLGDPLEPFFSRIARELREQYVLTYQPTATTGKGNFHSIEVKIKGSQGSGLKVRTRKGYLADKP